MRDPQYELGLPARNVAWVIWASMVAMPVLFLGVVTSLQSPRDVEAAPADLLLLLAVGTSALGYGIAVALPPRIPLRQGAGRAHLTALTRLVLRWSICEGVAIFPLVAFLLERDARLLVVFAADLAAILLSPPTRSRWRAAIPGDPAASARPPDVVH